MATEERVLCFERKVLEELGLFQGLNPEVEKYLPVVTSSAHLRYLNRSEAVNDAVTYESGSRSSLENLETLLSKAAAAAGAASERLLGSEVRPA